MTAANHGDEGKGMPAILRKSKWSSQCTIKMQTGTSANAQSAFILLHHSLPICVVPSN